MSSDCMALAQQIDMVNAYLASKTFQIVLNTSATGPTPQTAAFSAIVEPTGAWYVREETTPYSAYVDANGLIRVDFSGFEWDYSGSATETIHGWAVVQVVASNDLVVLTQGVFNVPAVIVHSASRDSAGTKYCSPVHAATEARFRSL